MSPTSYQTAPPRGGLSEDTRPPARRQLVSPTRGHLSRSAASDRRYLRARTGTGHGAQRTSDTSDRTGADTVTTQNLTARTPGPARGASVGIDKENSPMRSLLAAFLALILPMTECAGIEDGEETPTATAPAVTPTETPAGETEFASTLRNFDDCDALLAHIRTEAMSRVGPYGLGRRPVRARLRGSRRGRRGCRGRTSPLTTVPRPHATSGSDGGAGGRRLLRHERAGDRRGRARHRQDRRPPHPHGARRHAHRG